MTGMHSRSKLAEFKSELGSGGDAVRELLRGMLQEILEEEMTEALGAAKGERTSDRLGYRSGYCKRHLTTRVGQIELRVPQDRNGAFSTELFERYERSEKAFVLALMQMQVHGVSTRKVAKVTEALCGHGFSASTISRLNAKVAFHHLDRVLGLEGKTVTPGAESLYADVAGSESYGQASRKLKNLSGVEVSASTLQRHVVRIGGEIQAFEREDAEAAPPAKRVLLGIDGTGVPMAACEVEGVAGKQADGTAKTREAKAVVCRAVDTLDPKTGEPRKDRNSGAVNVRIDSARSVNGAGRTSEFAARLEQFLHRNGVFAAEEVAVLSDGAPWIRTVCEEILPGRKTTFILDLYHALEYASDAVQAVTPDKGKQAAWMDWIRKQLDAGRAERVVAALKRHRRLEAVAACIRYCEANMDRMRYDPCRRRGLPVGSGVVESACKRIVGSRLKGAGRRWSKAGANAVLATGCCLENRRWPDFLDWRDCSAAAA